MRRTLSTLAAVAALVPVLLVAGCGNDNTSADASSDSASASNTPSETAMVPSSSAARPSTVLNVKVQGDKVTPNGERIKAKIGEPVIINVNANRAGELHVHSTPEQELEYHSGKTTLKLTIGKPGIVDIEDHIAEVVVVQLEVS
ncbi:MAG: hypothetical protein ACJ72A_15350 [Nocardioidaceae bacterium]